MNVNTTASRRSPLAHGIACAVGATLLTLAGPAAQAQAWPAKPVRTIVPFAPGGPLDSIGRLVNERLAQRLGQAFVMENRGGAGGNIGTDAALKAAPDGYTFAWVVDFVLTHNPALYPKMPFDVEKDLQPVASVTSSEVALVAHPALAAKTMGELVTLARQKPIAFPSAGVGSPGHVFGELFKHEFKLEQMTHVPYKGNAPATQSIIAGDTQAFFGSLSGALPHIRTGKLRPLAVFSRQRLPYLAEVPTALEQGFAKFEVRAWFAIVAPAATPREIVLRLNREVAAIAAERDFVERVEKAGHAPFVTTPEEMRSLIRSEGARWQAVIKSAGIRAE